MNIIKKYIPFLCLQLRDQLCLPRCLLFPLLPLQRPSWSLWYNQTNPFMSCKWRVLILYFWHFMMAKDYFCIKWDSLNLGWAIIFCNTKNPVLPLESKFYGKVGRYDIFFYILFDIIMFYTEIQTWKVDVCIFPLVPLMKKTHKTTYWKSFEKKYFYTYLGALLIP